MYSVGSLVKNVSRLLHRFIVLSLKLGSPQSISPFLTNNETLQLDMTDCEEWEYPIQGREYRRHRLGCNPHTQVYTVRIEALHYKHSLLVSDHWKGGRANVFFKSANRKSANFWAQSQICKFLRYASVYREHKVFRNWCVPWETGQELMCTLCIRISFLCVCSV
jgi:hypothetical protein